MASSGTTWRPRRPDEDRLREVKTGECGRKNFVWKVGYRTSTACNFCDSLGASKDGCIHGLTSHCGGLGVKTGCCNTKLDGGFEYT